MFPFSRNRSLTKKNVPCMSLEMITAGLETCIEACSRFDADIQYPTGNTH